MPSKFVRHFYFTLGLISCLGLIHSASAQDATVRSWIPTGEAAWEFSPFPGIAGSNWQYYDTDLSQYVLSAPPTAMQDALIDTGGTVVVSRPGAIAKDLYLRASDTGPSTLSIRTGGTLSAATVNIGSGGISSFNQGGAEVTGAGATLNVSDTLYVGHGYVAGDQNSLLISAGGVVNAHNAFVGLGTLSGGKVKVTDSGSALNVDTSLNMGDELHSVLTVSNGGTVKVADGAGTISVGGVNGTTINIGEGGAAGTLQAAVVNLGAYYSVLNFDHNEAAYVFAPQITGTYATLTQTGSGKTILTATHSNVETLRVEHGTLEVTGSLEPASEDGLANAVVGADIGDDGHLLIDQGGVVTNNSSVTLGAVAGSHGKVTVSGSGSVWNAAIGFRAGYGSANIGEAGSGELLIADGGSVNPNGGMTLDFIGHLAGSEGAVTVTGAGSRWQSNEPSIGDSGHGTLTIKNGGAVKSTNAFIGTDAGGAGEVLVTGADSSWNLGGLNIGVSGTGSLTIAAGAKVTDTNGAYLGSYDGNVAFGSGTVVVKGAGSEWTSGGVSIGSDHGTGNLTVQDGGKVTSLGVGVIGRYEGSSGTALVTGARSTWSNSGELIVGNVGSGSLTIENGAMVSTDEIGRIGGVAGSTGNVLVAGAGSLLQVGGDLKVAVRGGNGTGVLTVQNGGEVIASGGINMAGAVTDIGILNLGGANAPAAPGTLDTPSVISYEGDGSLNFNHTSTNYAFATPAGKNVLIGGGIKVNQIGPGTTILGGTTDGEDIFDNSYTGGTIISAGKLVATSQTALGSGAVHIKVGGTLEIAETLPTLITHDTTFEGGGTLNLTLNPDDTAGALYQITGELSLLATSGNPFTISLSGLDALPLDSNYHWSFLMTSIGISGYEASSFHISQTGWSVGQDGTSLTLNYSAVPEPSSWALLALGLALTLISRRLLRCSRYSPQ